MTPIVATSCTCCVLTVVPKIYMIEKQTGGSCIYYERLESNSFQDLPVDRDSFITLQLNFAPLNSVFKWLLFLLSNLPPLGLYQLLSMGSV